MRLATSPFRGDPEVSHTPITHKCSHTRILHRYLAATAATDLISQRRLLSGRAITCCATFRSVLVPYATFRSRNIMLRDPRIKVGGGSSPPPDPIGLFSLAFIGFPVELHWFKRRSGVQTTAASPPHVGEVRKTTFCCPSEAPKPDHLSLAGPADFLAS